jgi:nitroreductase
LVVLAKKDVRTYLYDGSLVMGNLMLAAHSEGVASCWIHRAKEVFASPEGKEILGTLGIEGDYEGIGNCILGYADGPLPAARERKENYVYYIQ